MTTILIIDDDPDVRAVVKLCLVRLGAFRVIEASGGPEGLRMARDHQPDAILLDLMMPGMDGLECLARLREDSGSSLPRVLLMTARSDVSQSPPPDVQGVIGKPFDPLDLVGAVQRVVA